MEAEPLRLQVIEVSKRLLGAEPPDTLVSMSNLKSTYRQQGRRDEAESLEVQVLETQRRVRGAENPGTLVAIHNLARTWYAMGLEEKAIELMDQCVQTRCRILGPGHPHTATRSDGYDGGVARKSSIGEGAGSSRCVYMPGSGL